MAESVVKCLFCQAPSKYSCPQCSIRYCSVKCYQSESHLECSENFYKEQVMKQLKGMKGNTEDKQNIMKMLTKLNNHDVTDDISLRLHDVCLDDVDQIWEKLTEQEKHNFQQRIETGNLDFVELWEPWWISEKKSSKIVEVNKARKSDKLPKILKDLPHLKDILKSKKPDENLVYNIMEIILVYTYLMRLFNGDIYDSPEETIDVMLMLSKVLSENLMYDNLETCLLCFIQNVVVNKELPIDPVSISLDDLVYILTSSDQHCLRVLSDFYTFLKRYQKELAKDQEHQDRASHLYKLSKKVYFLIVYCQDEAKNVRCFHGDVSLLQQQLLEDRKLLNEQKEDIEANLKKLTSSSKPLIQEL